MAYIAAALLALSSFARAASLEDRSISAAVCLVVDPVVAILHAYPSASPFCSSFLAIPTITTTKIVSTTASFSSPITTTVPTTVSTFTSTADPVTVYSTSVTTITTCVPSAFNKRNIVARAQSSTTSSSSRSSSSKSAGSNISGACAGCPNVLKDIACDAISTACRCLSIATPTSTVYLTQTLSTTAYPTSTVLSSIVATITTTSTTTIPTASTSTVYSCPTPPSSCNNEGFRWGYYYNNQQNYNGQYTNYNPAVIKSEDPEYQNTTVTIGGYFSNGDSTPVSIYGSSETFSGTQFTLNHVGYFFAQVSGTYTFSITSCDDIGFLWLGATAYSGWTQSNANGRAIIGNTAGTIELVAGQYLPFRVIFGQAGGAAGFGLGITGPDGSTSDGIVLQYCDEASAPAFPAFGSET